jgi:molybdopterin synthase catalytic subunit
VLVFGPLRERVGVAEVRVAGTTVQEVWNALVRLHPAAAGGSDDPSPVRVWVTDAPIDIGSVIASAGTSHDGAIATFVGRVRDHSDGVEVHRMDYEAYAEMAESEMLRIGNELYARGGISTITIVHRTGSLLIGDASVVVVVAAPHRDTAFPACQEALELIKSTVPVWKREHRTDGARWVDARHGAHDAATP